MKESGNQKLIMNEWEKYGGRVVNGTYTRNGEHDLQGGFPYNNRLYDCTVEVKTEWDYTRVMEALEEVTIFSEKLGREITTYNIINIKKLKKHEPLQVIKANETRELGGLALFAYKFEQVKRYCLKELR